MRGAEYDTAAQAGVVAYGALGTIGVSGPHGEGAVAVVVVVVAIVGVAAVEVVGVAPGNVAAGTAGRERWTEVAGVSCSVHCL